MNITGGEYTDNKADNGAVLALSEGSTFNVKGGDFHENKAEEFGGVAIVEGEAKLSIDGGTYWNNNADNGGVFAVEIDGSIAVRKSHGPQVDSSPVVKCGFCAVEHMLSTSGL